MEISGRSEATVALERLVITVVESMKTTEQKEKDVCDFYRAAYCGKSARIVRPDEKRSFEIVGVVEIETGDERGTFFVANVKEL